MLELIFLGATQTVTGSKYLLKTRSHSILVDCGLFQGFKELRLRNWTHFPVPPRSIDAIVLTHAHIDHSGYIPLLVKNGFSGPIYGSAGTCDLCSILLPDSGHLQEEDAKFANKHSFSKHKPALPLYTREDALNSLKQFQVVDFDTPMNFFGELDISWHRAGHILGASFVRVKTRDTHVNLLFSGDIGRLHDPVMKPPSIVQDVDYLVVESTYGNRLHDRDDTLAHIARIVNDTVNRGGKLIIPAFAVGRSQSMLFYIQKLKQLKRIPDIPVFLDSPMAISATELLNKHKGDHKLSEDDCKLLCDVAIYTNTPEESEELDKYKTPIIILSASGMATGGRILHHLIAFASDPRNTLLFTGFQAGGTRGDRILRGEKEIKIFGQYIPVEAHIESLTNTSAHADYQEILQWLAHLKNPPKKVFVTHGDPEAANAMKDHIESKFGWDCCVPTYLDRITL